MIISQELLKCANRSAAEGGRCVLGAMGTNFRRLAYSLLFTHNAIIGHRIIMTHYVKAFVTGEFVCESEKPEYSLQLFRVA